MTDKDSYELACAIARLLDNKLAKDISILDISKVSVLADYFVICSADATTQVKALTENVREKIKAAIGRTPSRVENDLKNRWNLVDYGDVIVHIMHRDEREFYTIEKFWSHACMVERDEWMKETENIKDSLM